MTGIEPAPSADAEGAATGFPSLGVVRSVTPLAGGHIHETWLVVAATGRFVLQRCNREVFADLETVMATIADVVSVLESPLRVVPSADGGPLLQFCGSTWRAFPFLEGTMSGAPVRSPERALELARALGEFHGRLNRLDPSRVPTTLPGFHDVSMRLAAFDGLLATGSFRRRAAAAAEIDAVESLRYLAQLEDELRPPAVPRRIAHFDAKADNFLLDRQSGRVRAIIDLDTVMPGSVLWDVGDLARSATGPDAEDEADLTSVVFDSARWQALVHGYITATEGWLTTAERRALPVVPLVVTFEQAVRFLTDYLDGDRYYRVLRAEHNLERGRCQLALLQSMRAQESAMIVDL